MVFIKASPTKAIRPRHAEAMRRGKESDATENGNKD